MKKLISLAIVFVVALPSARAEVRTRAIEYRDGDLALEGHLAWDDAVTGKRPGVLVVHEWWGLNDYARRRAEMLAKLGYAAFAIDMYGKGKTTSHPREAREWATQIRSNIEVWQRRARLGLDVLRKQESVDPERIGAIGYCFGGATVMQLAYSGAEVKAVASFHGSLPTPPPGQGKEIRARVLACHGADDAFVPREQVELFQKALADGKADWQFVSYGGAAHSFTNPDADKAGVEGLAYDEKADKRSWAHLRIFLEETFATGDRPAK